MCVSNEIVFWSTSKGYAAFPSWKGMCRVHAQILFLLTLKSKCSLRQWLRGHLFSSELKLVQPLLYQCFTKMNSSSISYNWSLWATHLFLPRNNTRMNSCAFVELCGLDGSASVPFFSCIWAEKKVSWEFAWDLLGREVSEMQALCFSKFSCVLMFREQFRLSRQQASHLR